MVALALAAAACGSPARAPDAPPAGPAGEAARPDPAWRTAAAPDGRTTCAWRVAGADAPPRNQEFALEARLARDGRPLEGASLVVHGFMPDHGHGLVRRPRSSPTGPGTFLVEGVLLHMRGHWQLFFDVHEEAGVTTVAFDLEL
jgi:hypothetical protein